MRLCFNISIKKNSREGIFIFTTGNSVIVVPFLVSNKNYCSLLQNEWESSFTGDKINGSFNRLKRNRSLPGYYQSSDDALEKSR